jgi:hypothetical protein
MNATAISNITQCINAGYLPAMANNVSIGSTALNYGTYTQSFSLMPMSNSQDQLITVVNTLTESMKVMLTCNNSAVVSWIQVEPTETTPQAEIESYTCGQNYTIAPNQNVSYIVYSSMNQNVTIFSSVNSLAKDCVSCVAMGMYWEVNQYCSSIYTGNANSFTQIS